jgi:hypothetical protein
MEVVHGEIRWRHSLEFIPTYSSPPAGINAFEKLPKIPLAFFSMRTQLPISQATSAAPLRFHDS